MSWAGRHDLRIAACRHVLESQAFLPVPLVRNIHHILPSAEIGPRLTLPELVELSIFML